jgi:hypothetical protein
MDVLKAAGKVGAVGRQAMASVVQQQQLVTEGKVLAELRADALSIRAQIGEEMYKLWKAGEPCPRWLDELCQALEGTSAAIGRQRALIDQLSSGAAVSGQEPDLDELPPADVVEGQVTLLEEQPAGSPALAAVASQPGPLRVTCPTCGETDAPGRRFCGSCGSKLP